MVEQGKYIYCIANEIGNHRKIDLVHYKDITAVVSNTPIINFDRLAQKELTNYIVAHQKVNEEIMKETDVVPMVFGIIAPSAEEVQRILKRAYLQFKTALKKVQGKAEFVVQVWWDKNIILEELIKLQDYIKNIQAILNSCSHGSTLNKLLDKDMIANFSFLIEKAKESDLDKKMQELGKKYDGKLRFKYIGPMPAYSFVNINLSLGNFELVNKARKLLGLDKEAAFDEIKKAYYALAHKYHPDKYGGQSATEEKMQKIAHAYSILENYCQSYKPKGRKYSFREKEVNNSIIIK